MVKKNMPFLACVIAAVLVCTAAGPLMGQAAARPFLMQDFKGIGNRVGTSFQIGGNWYQNYRYGYAIKTSNSFPDGIETNQNAFDRGELNGFVALKQIDVNGNETLIDNINQYAHDVLIGGNARYNYPVFNFSGNYPPAALTAIAAKFNALLNEGIIPGIVSHAPGAWNSDGNPIICFAFGNSDKATISHFNASMAIIYNPNSGRAYSISDVWLNALATNRTWMADMGAPLSDSPNSPRASSGVVTSVSVEGTTSTFTRGLMRFDNGYIYINDSGAFQRVTMLKWVAAEGTYRSTVLDPPPVPETFGVFVNRFESGSTIYFNFRNGYATKAQDGTKTGEFFGLNVSVSGDTIARTVLTAAIINAGGDIVQTLLGAAVGGLGTTVNVGGETLTFENGVQPFEFGYAHATSEGKLRITGRLLWDANARRYMPGGPDFYAKPHYFGNYTGIVRYNDTNYYNFDYGYAYDYYGRTCFIENENVEVADGVLKTIVKPYFLEEYGTELNRVHVGKNVYINYRHGAIAAIRNNADLGFVFQTWPARSFDENGLMSEIRQNELPYFLGLIDTAFANNEIQAPDGMAARIKAKYEDLWQAGYILGIIAKNGHTRHYTTWDTLFFDGDNAFKQRGSTMYWGAYMVYHPETGDVYYANGRILYGMQRTVDWLDNFYTYGLPRSDPTTESNGDIWQIFDAGLIINRGDVLIFMPQETNDNGTLQTLPTYQDYLNLPRPVTPNRSGRGNAYIGGVQ